LDVLTEREREVLSLMAEGEGKLQSRSTVAAALIADNVAKLGRVSLHYCLQWRVTIAG